MIHQHFFKFSLIFSVFDVCASFVTDNLGRLSLLYAELNIKLQKLQLVKLQFRALILYRRRRFINHLLTYLLKICY